MPKNALFFIICWTAGFLLLAPESGAKPAPVNSLFEEKPLPQKKGKKEKPKATPLPGEYQVWEKARAMLEKPLSPGAIEEVEREILLVKLKVDVKPLEKEFEELFYGLEISKGALLSKKKIYPAALEAFQRGLSGLGTFKWLYYWNDAASDGLVKICTRKKTDNATCLALARRVSDAFPKGAVEMKAIRELPLPDAQTYPDFTGERLSIGYAEKKEKDEEAFQELLDHYLKSRDSDYLKSVKTFLEQFPRSALRFRARFLQAEVLNRGTDKKAALPIYQEIIDQIPLGYYSILSSERLGIDLKLRIKAEPIQVDVDGFILNPQEKAAMLRLILILKSKNPEALGIELESFTRLKNYSNEVLLFLMKAASVGGQHLPAFRLANELIQRRYPLIPSGDMLEMLFPDPYPAEVSARSMDAKLDPWLVTSLIKQESGFRASVISSSGALGLMQLMPFTALDTVKDLRLSTLKEPAKNIEVGVKYFQGLMEKYEGNPAFALAAYNAGPHRVAKWRKEGMISWSMIDWIEAIPFKETRDYVTSILRNRYWYQVRKNQPVDKITELKGLTVLPAIDKN
jgi:tetratricopeptide (TPR) repeat protein